MTTETSAAPVSATGLLSNWRRARPVAYVLAGVAGAVLFDLVRNIEWSRLGSLMNANEGVAAWVQAIGSVGAIGAVAVIASLEGRRASRALRASQALQKEAWAEEERRAAARRISTRAYAKEIAKGAVDRCEMVYESTIKDHETSLCAIARVWGRDFDFLKGQLADVPKYLLEETDLVAPMIRMALLVGDITDGLNDLERYATSAAGDLAKEREACRVTAKNMETRIGTMKKILATIESRVGV